MYITFKEIISQDLKKGEGL